MKVEWEVIAVQNAAVNCVTAQSSPDGRLAESKPNPAPDVCDPITSSEGRASIAEESNLCRERKRRLHLRVLWGGGAAGNQWELQEPLSLLSAFQARR